MSNYEHTSRAGPTSFPSKRERLLSDAQLIQRAANGVSLPKVRTAEESLARVDAAAKGESVMTRDEQLRRIDATLARAGHQPTVPSGHHQTDGYSTTPRDLEPDSPVVNATFEETVRRRFKGPVGQPLIEIPIGELKVTPDKRVFIDLEVLLGLLR